MQPRAKALLGVVLSGLLAACSGGSPTGLPVTPQGKASVSSTAVPVTTQDRTSVTSPFASPLTASFKDDHKGNGKDDDCEEKDDRQVSAGGGVAVLQFHGKHDDHDRDSGKHHDGHDDSDDCGPVVVPF